MKVLIKLSRTFLERKGAPKNFKSGFALIRVRPESFGRAFSKARGVQGQRPCKTAFLFLQGEQELKVLAAELARHFFFAPCAVKEKKRQTIKVNVRWLIYA